MVAPIVNYNREPTAKGYPGMVATTEPHWISESDKIASVYR